MQRIRHSLSLVTLAGLLMAGLLAGCSTVSYTPAPEQRTPPAARPTPAPSSAPAASSNGKKGGGYYLDDGPGESIPPNLDSIPDAVPRAEPLRPALNRPYTALGATFTPMRSVQPFTQTGIGSWYGKKFHGAKTSSGERYDMFGMSAAHPTLPIPSYARVTNLDNGRSVVVRVNDRGPFLHSRIIDLSYAAAWKLGYVNQGSARLQVDTIIPDELDSFIATNPALAPSATSAQPSTPQASAPSTASAPATPATMPPPAVAAAPTPATQPSAAPVATTTTQDPGVFLQIGAFASAANADSFREYVQGELKWLQHGIRTELVGEKYRLWVGPFRDAGEARSIGERIAARIRVQPFLVQR